MSGEESPKPAAPVKANPSHGGHRGLVWGLWAVFGLLLTAAAFVFLATPVSLEVEPEPDTLLLEGTLPMVMVGERRLALPGEYSVVARLNGYRETEERFQVSYGEHRKVSLKLKKLPGTVAIDTKPVTDAKLFVDDKEVGTSPLTGLELVAGEHKLRTSAERYLDAELTLKVEGMGVEQSVELKLTPAWSAVSFSSEPSGAQVWIDGKQTGATPLVTDLMQGSHKVEIRRKGFSTASAEIEIEADTPLSVPKFTLQEATGRVKLTSSPAGATVSLDGNFAGKTPLTLDLTPRQFHKLRLTLSGHHPAVLNLSVKPGASVSRKLKLKPELGVVFITSDPVDAELLVDGKLLGPATGRHQLSSSKHRIEIRKEGYEPYSATIEPRNGITQNLEVTLKSEEQARLERMRAEITTVEGQTMRLIRTGRIRLGASRREPGRRANEALREVEITRHYYLAVHEVTNREFRLFRPDHSSGIGAGEEDLDGDDQPVANVGWADAAEYLNWLSEKDGLEPAYEKVEKKMVAKRPLTNGYRLPTEAEWAYAARYSVSGKPQKYHWGGPFPPRENAGNYADSSAAYILPNVLDRYMDNYIASAPVGSYAANQFGLHDMGGNVAEWCNDFYTVAPGKGIALAKDPLGPERGRHHVVRGSSWRHASIGELRLSYRDYSEKPRPDLGFRFARYAE